MAAKPVSVNFVFANFEKRIVASTTTAATGSDLKSLLQQNWPDTVPPCEDRSRIRLICMGSGFITDDVPLGKVRIRGLRSCWENFIYHPSNPTTAMDVLSDATTDLLH